MSGRQTKQISYEEYNALVEENARLKQGHIWDLRAENDELKAELTAMKQMLADAPGMYLKEVAPGVWIEAEKAADATHTAKVVEIKEIEN